MANTMPSLTYYLPKQQNLEKLSLFSLCHKNALHHQGSQNQVHAVTAGPEDLIFSWWDRHVDICPMVTSMALAHINSVLKVHGQATAFGHSLCIGGAFYLTQKIDPEIVCHASHWQSLVYKAYIHTLEQIPSCHLGNMLNHHFWAVSWVGCVSQSLCKWFLLGKQLVLWFMCQTKLSLISTSPISSYATL